MNDDASISQPQQSDAASEIDPKRAQRIPHERDAWGDLPPLHGSPRWEDQFPLSLVDPDRLALVEFSLGDLETERIENLFLDCAF